jgi:predicted murein hydrolase (TIGR00659 family)
MIEKIANSEIFFIALTLAVYLAAMKLFSRFRFFLFTPVLVSVIVIVFILKTAGITYGQYNTGGSYISFLLKPAIVALGVPLYLQLEEIRRRKWAVLLSQLAGCVAGIVSVVLFARLFGATRETILSLVPKSVTTPIAIEISSTLGGIPPRTAGIVVTVGIFGSAFGLVFLKICRIKDADEAGLALGTAAHGLGTARATEEGPIHGAYASLGMPLNGILTALLSPWIMRFFQDTY